MVGWLWSLPLIRLFWWTKGEVLTLSQSSWGFLIAKSNLDNLLEVCLESLRNCWNNGWSWEREEKLSCRWFSSLSWWSSQSESAEALHWAVWVIWWTSLPFVPEPFCCKMNNRTSCLHLKVQVWCISEGWLRCLGCRSSSICFWQSELNLETFLTEKIRYSIPSIWWNGQVILRKAIWSCHH